MGVWTPGPGATAGNDSFQGDDAADIIDGGDGADDLRGGGGDDQLTGGLGNDLLIGEAGSDTLNGGDGADILQTVVSDSQTGVTDIFNGGAGDDIIWIASSTGVHTVDGGTGVDTVAVYNSNIQAPSSTVGVETAIFVGGALGSSISGGFLNGVTRFFPGARITQTSGGVWDLRSAQILTVTTLFGTSYTTSAFEFFGSAENDTVLLPSLAAIRHTFAGEGGDDTVSAGLGDDDLRGGAGNDTLTGGAGNDFLLGDEGNDILAGGDGDDLLQSLAIGSQTGVTESYSGGAGEDLIWLASSAGQFAVDGGSGNDTVNLYDAQVLAGSSMAGVERVSLIGGLIGTTVAAGVLNGVTSFMPGARLTHATAGVTDLSGAVFLNSITLLGTTHEATTFEFFGSSGNDTLLLPGSATIRHEFEGGAGDDTVVSGGGNDDLRGDVGDDRLTGGGGNDVIVGDAGNDQLFGGDGDDVLQSQTSGDEVGVTETYAGDAGNDRIILTGASGIYTVDGGAGTDTLQLFNATISAGSTVTGIETAVAIGGLVTSSVAAGALSGVTQFLPGARIILNSAGVTDLSSATFLTSLTLDGVEHTASAFEVTGTGQADTLILPSATTMRVVAALGGGADTITSGGGADDLRGGDGDDTLTGGGGDDLILGESGNDSLYGGAGNDHLQALLSGAQTNVSETYSGGDGDDLIWLGSTAGVHQVSGGTGVDTVTLFDAVMDAGSTFAEIERVALIGGFVGTTVAAGVLSGVGSILPGARLTLSSAGETDLSSAQLLTSATIQGVTYTATQFDIAGSSGADIVRLSASGTVAALIEGNAGNDTLVSGGGADALFGGDGDDVLDGGAGNDLLDGGVGVNGVSYASLQGAAGVAVTLGLITPQDTGAGGVDFLLFIRNLTGSQQNDTLNGDGVANVLEGLNGDDVIAGGGGDDDISGGAGNDTLRGGDGADTANYAAATAAVTVSLALAGAQNTIGAGRDTLEQIENLLGSSFNDTLFGDAGANLLTGGAGEDVLSGGAGNDILRGGDGSDSASYADSSAAVTVSLAATGAQNTAGAGVDTLEQIENLIGSAFNDTLIGGSGANILVGGAGDDVIYGDDGPLALIAGDSGIERALGGVSLSGDSLLEQGEISPGLTLAQWQALIAG